MADIDDYDYLERQLDPKAAAPVLEERVSKREHKDKDRDREHRHRSRSHERRRDKDDRRERDGDRDRRGDKDRRDRDRDRDRERERDRRIERPRSPRRRAVTPPEVRAAREAEKELREMERSTRTVFAYNLNLKAEDRDIFQFFSTAGKVLDVKLITDKNTKRSKGFAYIEYAKVEDVLNAVSLTGQLFMGQAIMVKSSEHEKNIAWEAQQQAKMNQLAAATTLIAVQGAQAPSGPCKLYVANLNPQIGEQEVQALFQPFGLIEFVQIVRDATGRSQGYGYVQFSSVADATKAMGHWNGATVAGVALKVTISSVAATAAPEANYNAGIAELDEEEEKGGLKLTSDKRQALMNRLASSAGLQPMPAFNAGLGANGAHGLPPMTSSVLPSGPKVDPSVLLIQSLLGPSSPIPTPCILIKNMFDPQESAAEMGPGWAAEIQHDVQEECSKYGPVVHAYVDQNSKGCVYLKFASPEGAAAAQNALHGRFFAGRQLAAEFQFMQPYNSFFRT